MHEACKIKIKEKRIRKIEKSKNMDSTKKNIRRRNIYKIFITSNIGVRGVVSPAPEDSSSTKIIASKIMWSRVRPVPYTHHT
jgi:hypothetical protein